MEPVAAEFAATVELLAPIQRGQAQEHNIIIENHVILGQERATTMLHVAETV